MTRRRTRKVRPYSAAASLAVAAVAVSAEPADAQLATQLSGDVSVREGVTTNPFLDFGGGDTSGYVEFSAAPSFVITEPLASTNLSANYRRTQYYQRYGSTDGYGFSAFRSQQLSSRTSANVSLQYDSAVVGERRTTQMAPGAVVEPSGPNTGNPDGTSQNPDFPTVIDTNDPTLIGTRTRSSSLGLSGNLSTSLNPFDSFSLAASVSRNWYGSRFGADSRTYTTTGSYNRTLGQGSTVGVRLSATRSNYLTDGIPDSTILQPQVTYSRQLSGTIHLNASVGGLFIQSSSGRDTKSISGDIDLCRTGERDSLCLSVSRDASASGAGGVRTNLVGMINYSYRLAQYDTIRININYSHYGAFLTTQKGSTYVDTEATWETRLGRRILGGTTASLRGIQDEFVSRRDFSLQAYVRVTLGQLL